MEKIDIIMVTYNRLEFTKKSIEAILEKTKHPYNLHVIDNNSTDGTQDYLQKLYYDNKLKSLIFNDENLGLERALNQGFFLVNSKYMVTIDNDIIVSKNWLSRLLKLMKDNPEFGCVSCRPHLIIGVGPVFKTDKDVVEVNCVGSHGRMFKTSTLRRTGGWDENFKNDGRGSEDQDICGKLKKLGKKPGYAKEVFCYHQFGKDEKWGYGDLKSFRMGRSLEKSPLDIEYDPLTCEPNKRFNE